MPVFDHVSRNTQALQKDFQSLWSSNFQHITFFFLCSRAIIVLYCIVTTRGHYLLLLLLLAPPPPHAAAARRRTPPSSHHPPPPLPQHATAVTPESFADVPVCPYPRSYSSTIEQRIAWLASCKSCCCRRFSRLVPHSNDQHRRLAIVVRRRRLVAGPAALRRGEGRQSTVLEGRRQGRGRRGGFRVRGWTS